MSLLWILISYRSQVFEPSPQGLFHKVSLKMLGDAALAYVFLVTCLRCLVGSLTGPLTRRSLSLARLIKSVQTTVRSAISSRLTLVEAKTHTSREA